MLEPSRSWRGVVLPVGLLAVAVLFPGAAAWAQPNPVVTVEAPKTAFVGEEVTFSVKFKNAGSEAGYGPYVVLCLPFPGTDRDEEGESCDGMAFASAKVTFDNTTLSLTPVGGAAVKLQLPPSSDLQCTADPPVAGDPLCQEPFPLPDGSPGCQLVVLKLPFGSFFPDQPEMDVQVTLDVSDWADAGVPLTISAAGGFQYDDDPEGKKPCRVGDPVETDVEPAVYTVKKVPVSPEGQTASGPNFPRSYELVVDVADRQTVDPLTLTDLLPENAVFLGISEACEAFVTSGPAAGSVGGVLKLDFGSVEGGIGAEHQCEIRFFVPDLDANGAPILEVDRCRELIENAVEGGGLWNPPDPRDPTPEEPDAKVPLPPRSGEGTVLAQCLILLKGMPALVLDEGHPGVTPGDELEYTLVVEVSDYFQVGEVVIRDLLPDGLELLTTEDVSFSVAGAEPTSGTFVLGNDLLVEVADSPCGAGSTSLELRLSDALSGSGNPQGLLTGGLLATPQAGATRVTIRYRVRVRDGYRCPGAEDDGLVDKHDAFVNHATVQASLWDPDLGQPTAFTAEDPSSNSVAVPGEVVQETVYARNGTVLDPDDPLPVFAPGDEVTFRIRYLLPSTDAEALLLEKFLPDPVFDVEDPETGLHSESPVRVCPADPPPAGTLCFLDGPFFDFWKDPDLPRPGEDVCTERGYQDLVRPESNGFCVFFGDLDDPDNEPRKIDILFTVPITDRPFVDGLLLTNEVVESEEDSSGAVSQQEIITQITLGQPDLRLHKGVVGACCPEGEECLLREEPRGRLGPPSSRCEDQFEPPITSTNLAKAGLLKSYSGGFRRGDRVRFALVVENHGSSPHGAFNVTVQDVVPPGFAIPTGGADVCVRSGAGGDLPHSGELFGTGLVLTDPRPTQGALAQGAPSPADGSNLAVITYELEVAGLAPGDCVDNHASLARFTGTPDGPNHVRPKGEPSATAQVCHRWDSEKSFVATSESHTRSPAEGLEDLAVGEVVRFRLVTEVPEGSHAAFRIVDPLLPGLRYVPGSAKVALVSSKDGRLVSSELDEIEDEEGLWVPGNEATVSGITPDVAFDAPTATFDLGTVSNTDDDCDLELIVIEFAARAVNVPSNQHGTTMPNRFHVEIDGRQVSASNVVIVRVVEPKLVLEKRLVASQPGLSATFELTVTHPGPVTAFDLELDDLLPLGVTFVDQVDGPKLKVGADRRTLGLACCEKGEGDPPLCEDGEDERFCALAAGETIVIRFNAQLDDGVSCTSRNHAELTWTSLPGDHGTPLDLIVADTPGTQDGERTGTPTSSGGGPNDYRATAESPVTLPPDLHVTKSHAGEALPGNEVTYTLVVVNGGQGATTEAVEVVEEIPAGTIYAGGGGPDWQCPFAASPGPTSVTCVYQGPPLAPGATTELTIRVRLRDGAASPLVNCARVHTECDVVEENDRACDETCVGPSQDVTLEKDCDLGDEYLFEGPIFQGRFIGCSFAVRNVGCAATEADRPLHVVDTVPKGVRFGSEFPPAAWHCTETPGELTGCDLDGWVCSFQLVPGGAIDCRYVGESLGPGEEAPPLVLGFPIQAGEFDLEFEPKNCARVSYGGDAFPDNDVGCTSTCPDPADSQVDYLAIDPGLCPEDYSCPDGRYVIDGCGCRCEPGITVTAESVSDLFCDDDYPTGTGVALTIEGGRGPFACQGIEHPGRACFFAAEPGRHPFTVTDLGTGETKTVEVVVEPHLNLTVTSTPARWPFCRGGTATAQVVGGVPLVSYEWTPSGQSGATATGLAAGSHRVTVTDGLGCSASQQVTVGCTGRWDDVTHLHVAYASPSFDFAGRGLDLALEVSADGGAGFSLGWEHRFTRRFGLELGVLLAGIDYQTVVEPGDASPPHAESGSHDLRLVYGAARFHLLAGRRSDVYLAPLVGYADFGGPPRLEASEAPVYGLSLGFDRALGSRRWGLSGALRYLEGEVDVIAPDLGFSGSVDMDLLSTELGVSYRW